MIPTFRGLRKNNLSVLCYGKGPMHPTAEILFHGKSLGPIL
jgi:hypothetical protein